MKEIFAFLLLLAPFLLFATDDESKDPGPGSVQGKVVEIGKQAPVEFANVVLFRAVDSTMVTGVLTSSDGSFDVKNVPAGNYYIQIHLIGFEELTISDIILTKQNRNFDLGVVELGFSAINLKEAEIVGDRMTIEYKLDRKVINVNEDISSTGNTAVEILEKTPSVRVDADGTVYLRGSSNFLVLIDGKPSVLTGSEALQQIPANTIEAIEVITNPSVKYDPDGESGIINIRLKKAKLSGISGVANVTAATGDKYAADMYLNYKTGSFNIFGGVEWNDRHFAGSGNELRENYSGDTISYRDADLDMGRLRNGLKFTAGVDYNITSLAIISLAGEYSDYGFGMNNYQNVYEYDNFGTYGNYSLQNNQFRWKRNYYLISGNYNQKFRREKHEMNLYARFSRNSGSQTQDNRYYKTDENWDPVDDPELIRSSEEGPSNDVRIEFNYEQPVLTKGKVETGFVFRLDDELEEYNFEQYSRETGNWEPDSNYYKESDFFRSIYAVYGTFSHEFHGFEYQLGLRGEYTYRDITVTNTGESSMVDRFDYFPSVHISKRLKEKNQFQVSYSRRIERPRGWFLEPFVTYVNETTRYQGNPGLLPEYTDSYELGYIRTLPAGTTSLEGYFRKTDEKITEITTYDEETGIYWITRENLNDDRALGVEWSFLYDITKWFDINLSATYYYYQITDKSDNGDEEKRSSNNWDSQLIASFKLPTQTRIQLNFTYDSPSVTLQGRSEASHFTDITVRQDFLKKSLSATLSLSDIFGTRKRESYTYGDNFTIHEARYPEARVLSLTISYRLNNFKSKQNRNEDVDGMM